MAGAEILRFPDPSTTTVAGHLHAAEALADLEPRLADVLLCNRLHRHLDIHSLLEQFLRETADTLGIGTLRYTLPDTGEVHVLGNGRKPRKLRSRLQYGGEYLGEIEIEVGIGNDLSLTRALAPLIAPLSNALSHHRLQQLSRKDSLTGLGNRMALEAALATEAARAGRFGHAFALLVVDIDHFKRINDAMGHSAGDAVIRTVATQIQDCLRPYDQAFRFGGEEFVVLLSQTAIGKAKQIAERIRRRIAVQCRIDASPASKVTVSIGASELHRDEAVEELFNRADQALYQAKSAGRNRVIAAD